VVDQEGDDDACSLVGRKAVRKVPDKGSAARSDLDPLAHEEGIELAVCIIEAALLLGTQPRDRSREFGWADDLIERRREYTVSLRVSSWTPTLEPLLEADNDW
jgi:hypothetical protein